jgi:repressor LexA
MFGTSESLVHRDTSEMRNKWLKDRLKEVRKTQMGLAQALGLPRSRVSEMISGERKIGAGEVATIAAYLEWPADRVLAHLSDRSVLPLNLDPTPQRMGSITVVGEIAAGVFKDTLLYEPAEQFEMEIPTDPRYARYKKQGLRLSGPSMNLVYPEGSIVVVVSVIDLAEDGYEPKSGQRVIVQRSNDLGQVEATVKELQIDGEGHAWLWPRSDHPQFQQPWKVPETWQGSGEFDENADNLRITALVIGSYRPEI